MNDGNEFDKILHAALREYHEAEPLAGIEDRVLRRLQSGAARQPSARWRWRISAAALAALVALVWIGVRHAYQHRSSSPQLVQQKAPAVPISPEIAKVHSDQTHSTPERPMRHHAAKLPSARSAELAIAQPAQTRDQFPTPAPLDREERALLALAQSHPEALRAFIRHENSPTDIAPITIEPLEHSSGTEGEE